MAYALQHASAVRTLRRKGAAVTFTTHSPGAYNALLDAFGTPNPSTVTGYALGMPGDPRTYDALSLIESENPTLLFVPTRYGAAPLLGSSVVWSGATWIVKSVDQFSPDGTTILCRVIIGDGAALTITGTASFTAAATFAAIGTETFVGTAAFVQPGPGLAAVSPYSALDTLRAQLGDSVLPAIYDVHYGVTSTGGIVVDQWDDARGPAGFGPSLIGSGTSRPGWDPVNLLITGDGGDDRLAPSVNNTLFDFSTCRALIVIGVINADSFNKVLACVTNSSAETRALEFNGISGIALFTGAGSQIPSGVALSASMRMMVGSHNGSTTGTMRVASHTPGTGAITALASGSNRLTVFDYFPNGGFNAKGPIRAVLAMTREPTAGDLTQLITYAQAMHSIVVAA